MTVLRVLATAATLVGLLALGAAFGDFASAPSPLGAVGLLLVVAGVGFAVARLYGPHGVRESGPQVARAVAAPPKPRRRPKRRASVVEEAWGPRPEPERGWGPDDGAETPPAPSRAEERRRRKEAAEARREREAEEQRRREAEAQARREAEAEEAQRLAGVAGGRLEEPESAAPRGPRAPAGSAPERSHREPRPGLFRRSATTADGRLDLNRAAAREIAALPGVGPASGQRVVEDRRVNGPFTDVYDLTRVEGFTDARVRRFADKVTV